MSGHNNGVTINLAEQDKVIEKPIPIFPPGIFSGGSNSDSTWVENALISSKIDPSIEPAQSQVLATFNNIPFATFRNFSCIIGKAKSRKTFLITLIVGAFLRGIVDLINVAKFNNKNRIVWFDTEQGHYNTFKALHRAFQVAAGCRIYELEVYDLRPFSPQERLTIINTRLSDKNPENDIAFVVIDGIRDLVTDINDPQQATDTSTWLMKITAEKDLHICTVLHQNKADNNARGHLGTEIVNKSETVISIHKDSTDSNISIACKSSAKSGLKVR